MISLFLISNLVSASVNLQPKLLRDWTQELQNSEPCKTPFLVTYAAKGKTLYFIAANHGEGPLESSRTFRIIEDTFKKHSPTILVVEKLYNSMGVSPKDRSDEAFSCEKDKFRKCTEIQFAIYQAVTRKVPFIGGEPDDSIFLEELTGKYSAEDLVGFTSYVNLIRWKRRNETDFEKKWQTEKTTEEMQRKFKFEMTYSSFKRWFELKLGKPLTIENIDSYDIAPIKSSKNFLQNIAYDKDPIRERKIIGTIETALNKYDSVLVVYGAGHHVKQSPVFTEALAKPKYECYKDLP